MQLDTVQARFPGAAGAFGKSLYRLPDLSDRHALALEPMQGPSPAGGAQPFGKLDSLEIPLPSGVAQLHYEFRAVLVDRLPESPPERYPGVTVDPGIVGNDASLQLDRNEGRDDCTHSAARELNLPVDAGLVSRAIIVIESARDI